MDYFINSLFERVKENRIFQIVVTIIGGLLTLAGFLLWVLVSDARAKDLEQDHQIRDISLEVRETTTSTQGLKELIENEFAEVKGNQIRLEENLNKFKDETARNINDFYKNQKDGSP